MKNKTLLCCFLVITFFANCKTGNDSEYIERLCNAASYEAKMEEAKIINLVFNTTISHLPVDSVSLYMKDSLLNFNIRRVNQLLVPAMFPRAFSNIDTAFIPVIRCLSIDRKVRYFDFRKNIKDQANILWMDNSPAGFEPNIRNHNLSAGFSPVSFNSELNKAAICMQMNCGHECGGLSIYLLSRENGNWKLILERKMSVE